MDDDVFVCDRIIQVPDGVSVLARFRSNQGEERSYAFDDPAVVKLLAVGKHYRFKQLLTIVPEIA